MSQAILTFLANEASFGHAGLRVTLNSLDAVGYEGDLIIVSPVFPPESAAWVMQRHRTTVRTYDNLTSEGQPWRWLAYWKFLNDIDNDPFRVPYHHVLLTDAHDVLFQENPFDVMSCLMGDQDLGLHRDFVALGAEGPHYRGCGWNIPDMENLMRALSQTGESAFALWPIINASIVLGTHARVRDWCARIAALTMAVEKFGATDMAVTGWLYSRFLIHENWIDLCLPDERFVATGHSIAHGRFPVQVSWENGKLSGPRGVYSIFHQWNRTQFKDEILATWGRES